MARSYVKIDLEGLKKFRRFWRQGTKGQRGPVHGFFRQAAKRYLAFSRRRFVKFSRGGGTWPPLKESTLRRRRGDKGAAILRDTSVLMNALALNMPGSIARRIRDGIVVGYGGPSGHPKFEGTISDLAEVHQQGVPENGLPARPIIVEPDATFARGVRSDLKRAIKELEMRSNMR